MVPRSAAISSMVISASPSRPMMVIMSPYSAGSIWWIGVWWMATMH